MRRVQGAGTGPAVSMDDNSIFGVAPMILHQETGQARKPTVVIADASIAITGCVADQLAAMEIEVVARARHGDQVVAILSDTPIDVLLLGMLPEGRDSFWVCQEVRRVTKGATQVLFYVHDVRDWYLDRCVESGGSGMLHQQTTPLSEIVQAVTFLSTKGGSYYSPPFAKRLVTVETGAQKSRLAMLSPREMEVCRQLANGKTNREIADALGIGLRSTEKAVFDVKQALDIATTNQLLVFLAKENVV